MKSLGGKDEAELGSMMASPLRKHLFHITHFLLIRQMQLLSLNITLQICQPPTAILQVFVIL